MVVTYEGPFQKLFYETTLVVIFFTIIAIINTVVLWPVVMLLYLSGAGDQLQLVVLLNNF